MRSAIVVIFIALLFGPPASAEVTRVTLGTRAVVANGQAFGTAGPYEKLSGTIDFALDPADARNARIVDLDRAARDPDGRVRFSADLYVLRPVDAARGNGTLLFEVSNRGGKALLARFNGAAGGGADPTAPADFGDGFLMRQGFTLVWVGWEFDVPVQALGIDAPLADLGGPAPLRVEFVPDEAAPTASLARDAPLYPPARLDDPADTLSVRSGYWDKAVIVPRDRWRFVAGAEAPELALDGGFEAGRIYTVGYRATGARVAGVGLAAMRDTASAFRYRDDMPVRGRAAYVIGFSQSGRFLRQFLHEGFNVDERGRRTFDAVWAHIAGAARGSFNERLATPRGLHPFSATRPPFTDEPQHSGGDGLLAAYRREHRPKIFYTNTSVEYWGGGRAAALAHVSDDGTKDIVLPDEVRLYLLAGTQHGEAALPPRRSSGQELENPVPQRAVMRALLAGLHAWVSRNEPPPASRYPQLSDGTLTPVARVRFPAIAGVADPRRISGPGLATAGDSRPLPYLVPQVDADGNETGGIRVPEQLVPLATTTGWNFRAAQVGNPEDIYPLLGSYIPFAPTRPERESRGDTRRSIEERYRSRNDYLRRIRDAAKDLVKDRYLLRDDVEGVVQRAESHWEYAMRATRTN
jgi:hypothetical protein